MKELIASIIFGFGTFVLLFNTGLNAQTEYAPVTLRNESYYSYLDYLINRGSFTPEFVLQQPYSVSDIILPKEERAGRYFRALSRRYFQKQKVVINLEAAERLKYDKVAFNRYRINGGVHYINDNITLVNQTTVDQDYKRDPNFAGDLSEADSWLYGRVNDAYINVHNKRFSLFFGRIKRNWGPVKSPSLILSDEPYSYDHLYVRYQSGRLRLSLIFAQLEDVDGYNFFYPDSVFRNARKYLVGHRLDLRIFDHLQLAFTEMATYGGLQRDVEPEFFNPMSFYYPVQRNDREEMNGLWAVDLFYKPWPGWTIYGQFLIDDIIVNNDPGVDDRARYPDRLGVMASLRFADWPLGGLNSRLTYNRVWNRTYQAKFTWQNYHYRKYSLAYPRASCEEWRWEWQFWKWFPLWFSNETIYGRYGNVNLTDVYPLSHEPYPVKPVQKGWFNRFKLHFTPSHHWNAQLEITYREVQDHYSNRYGENGPWIFSLAIHANLWGGWSLQE